MTPLQLKTFCEDYFLGAKRLIDKSASTKERSLAALKILSFATVVIPLAFAVIYGISTLASRNIKITEDPKTKEIADKTFQQNPVPQPNFPSPLLLKTEEKEKRSAEGKKIVQELGKIEEKIKESQENPTEKKALLEQKESLLIRYKEYLDEEERRINTMGGTPTK